MSDERRIYVACLASYNAGILHGRWIDATLGEDHIQEEVRDMLRESPEPNVMVVCPTCNGNVYLNPDVPPCGTCKGSGKVPSAEEWAIHDYEGFGDIKLDEWERFGVIADLAEALEEHGDAYATYVGMVGLDCATPDDFQDKYLGEYRSREEWAEQFLEDAGGLSEMPENLRYYFDYEKYARDAELSGDISYENGYVFWNH